MLAFEKVKSLAPQLTVAVLGIVIVLGKGILEPIEASEYNCNAVKDPRCGVSFAS